MGALDGRGDDDGGWCRSLACRFRRRALCGFWRSCVMAWWLRIVTVEGGWGAQTDRASDARPA